MRAEPPDLDFRTQLEPHRRAITLHCYQMLGSLEDAEELAQEALLRAWQRRDERRPDGSLRAWLYRIATNLCLDVLKTRRRRALPHRLGPPAALGSALGPAEADAFWLEPAPDSLLEVADPAAAGPAEHMARRESIGLAFVAALQVLSPRQRAALLLVDVLGWSAQKAADLLGTSVASVNSLLQRARKGVEAQGVEEAPPPGPADDGLVRRYITTWESGDLEAFAALLAEDARLSMPPQPEWFAGREAIRRFLERVLLTRPRRYRLFPLRANGGLAVAVYTAPIAGGDFCADAINVLSVRGGLISELTRFGLPSLMPRFALPERLPA
jgi:RNA polymerase sigma-70 factor, ECF subfamily